MCPICQTDRNYGGIGIYIGSCSGCNGGFYFCTTVTDLLRRKNDGIDLYRFYSVILIGVVSFAMRRSVVVASDLTTTVAGTAAVGAGDV